MAKKKQLSLDELEQTTGGTGLGHVTTQPNTKHVLEHIDRTIVKDALDVNNALKTQDLKILITPKTLDNGQGKDIVNNNDGDIGGD